MTLVLGFDQMAKDLRIRFKTLNSRMVEAEIDDSARLGTSQVAPDEHRKATRQIWQLEQQDEVLRVLWSIHHR